MVLFTSTFSTLLPMLPQLLDRDDCLPVPFLPYYYCYHSYWIWMVLSTSTLSTLLPLLPQLLDGDDLFTSTFSTLLPLLPQLLDRDDCLPVPNLPYYYCYHNCCIWLILFTSTFSTLLPLLPQLLDGDDLFTSTFSTLLQLLPQLLHMVDSVYQYLFYLTTTVTTASGYG